MRAIRSPRASPRAAPFVDDLARGRRAARLFRAGRWFVIGLGGMLVLGGLVALFAPVTTNEGEPSCRDRLAIVAVFGSTTVASGDPDAAEWCREEARTQVLGGGAFTLFGALLVGLWVRPARRARRGSRDRRGVVGIGRTSDGLEPAQLFRTLPCRLVSDGTTTWLVVTERPDQATLLVVTGRPRSRVPFQTDEVEVAGDMSRRVACRIPGSDKVFAARPHQLDSLHHWWTARSQRRQSVGLASEVYGPPSHPSAVAAAASAPSPDPFQPAWAHPPARRRLLRSLWSACLMLAAAGLAVTVIVWAAVNHEDWFWERGNEGALADVFFIYASILIAYGAGGIAAFVRRRSVLRRQPWRLADIVTPSIGQVVLREHAGVLGPIAYKVAAPGHARARVLACRQLWFAEGPGGTLVAATPDFRTVVRLRPERTRRPSTSSTCLVSSRGGHDDRAQA